MKLADYLSEKNIRPAAFARLVSVPSSTIHRLLKGERGASLGLALRIAQETDGLVKPADLEKPTPSDLPRPAPSEEAA